MPISKTSFLAIAAVLLLACCLLGPGPALGQEGQTAGETNEPGTSTREETRAPEPTEQPREEDTTTVIHTAPTPTVRPVVAAGTPTSPPRNLKLVGDHWTPYDPPDPESFPPEATLHIIVRGDTLWDLAALSYGDPYLWPQIWNDNRYILDSHWIYPGDPLLIPLRPVVVTEVQPGTVPSQVVPQGQQGAPPAAPPEGVDTPAEPEPVPETLTAQAPPAPPAAVPSTRRDYVGGVLVSRYEVLCAGYISQRGKIRKKDRLFIGGQRDPAMVGLTEGDVVYLNKGRENGGIREGQEFSIIERGGKILHPVTDKNLGTHYRRMGVVKVLASLASTSVAVITTACDEIRTGNQLVPIEETTFPDRKPLRFDQLVVGEHGKPDGYIIHARDNVVRVATGSIVHIDLGSEDGLAPGDFLTVYQPYQQPSFISQGTVDYKYRWGNEIVESADLDRDDTSDFPHRILGQLVVLTTEGHTAAAKITHSVTGVELGARVEVQ